MAEERGTALESKLAKLRREGEERSARRLAEELGYPYIDMGKVPVSLEAMKLVPEATARAAGVAAIELKVKQVALAVRDPRLPLAQNVVKDLEAKRYTVKLFVASASGLEQAWHYFAFVSQDAKEITGKVDIGKQRLEDLVGRLRTFGAVQAEIQKFDFKSLQTALLLEVILAGALANRASDIHFESEPEVARIRLRIDGILHDIFGGLPIRNYEALVSRIKLLAGLKINVRGEPQDGRFTIGLQAKEIEVRVSVIPSEFGETIVMRILDPQAINVPLSELGLRPDDLEIVSRELAKPNGLILNTGPTGSGKTTTLYAFLQTISRPEIKIITIEDPIEYRIRGVEQTQVDKHSNYTFASGLRAIVRQDPDVVLVGEIRDAETADIALQAALTGHVVLSTLHTNDAVGAVARLIDLGVKPSVIGPALNIVIAQRLVRRLCEQCRKPAMVDTGLKNSLDAFLKKLPKRVDRKPYERYSVFEPGGCELCGNLGFRGRIGIFEFFETGDRFEEIILREPSEVALKRLAKEQEMVTMQEDGILKILSGVTTFAEVAEVTGEIVWR